MLAVAPLVKQRVAGVARLLLAGSRELGEPVDLAWSEPRALARLARVLARGGTPLSIDRMWAESPALAELRRAYRGRAIVVSRRRSSCSYLSLDESWLQPQQHLSTRRRADLRRARRRAEQLGAVVTEIRAPDLGDLPTLLDELLEVERRGWKGRAGTALAGDAVQAVFWRQYAQAACIDGSLRICFLRIGGRVAAMQLAVEQGGRFWLLKVGYDGRFARCSPGLLLVRETIRYAAEAGLHSYEFLGTAEPWTEMWHGSQRKCVSLSVYPIGVRGLWALAADLVAAGLSMRAKPDDIMARRSGRLPSDRT
jgi:CelD/BcsL family acetyltransferase involved in cellulose biosynthesis